MFKSYPALGLCLFFISLHLGALRAEPSAAWPQADFYVSFEAGTKADRSHGFGEPGGFGTEMTADGAAGSALRLTETGGHLHYLAAGNVSAESGTVGFATRGSAIAGRDGKSWLWAVRGQKYDFGLVVEKGRLYLRCTQFQVRQQPLVAEISVPLVDKDPRKWQYVMASWDSRRQKAWLTLDGEATEGTFVLPPDFGTPLVMYLGGGVEARLYEGGALKQGNEFDEFQVWMQSKALLDQYQPLAQAEAAELLDPMVAGIYKRLSTLESLQFNGGWQVAYTWPTLLGSFAQGRGFVDTENIVSLDKSNGTPVIASRYVYAYDVLGDESLLEIAKKTGDFLVAAQSEEGYWLSNYQFRYGTIEPLNSRNRGAEPKFQDGVQSQSIALLLALYKVTGKSEYIISAKKGGEFYLKAQNPDGSWSYKYDPDQGIGVTFLREPQGGEINDYAMNDALNIMVLLYHYTYDVRYLEAARRAADWLVAAKLSGNVHGWAQQYDNALQPASARHHEPAAYSSEDTLIASEALIEAYRLSGDERYLQPVREAAVWIQERFPDGTMYKYYDPETGRPVASWEKNLYYLDDPEQFKLANSFPQNPHVINKRPVPDLQALLDRAEAPVEQDTGLTASQMGAARRALESQNEAGLWIRDNVGGGRHTLGAGFTPSSIRAVHMLQFLESSYKAMNLAEPRLRHHGDLLRMAAPDNWYEVPWPSDSAQAAPSTEQTELKSGDFSVIIRTDPYFETQYGERRFDRLGRVSSVRLGGQEFLCLDGLVDEFGASGIGVLGWDATGEHRDFIKIGLGEMEAFHAAKPFYMNAQPHSVREVFPMQSQRGEHWWEARQQIEVMDGFSYLYTKRIAIDAAGSLRMDYALQNLGTQAFTFDQYNHAYLKVPAGAEGIELTTAFAMKEMETDGEASRSWRFAEKHKPGIRRFRPVESMPESALQVHFEPALGVVDMSLSPSARQLDCYQNAGLFCPELYYQASLEPGDTVRWTRQFQFTKSAQYFVTRNKQ